MGLLNFDFSLENLPEDAYPVAGLVSVMDGDGAMLLRDHEVPEEGSMLDLPGYPERITIEWHGVLADGSPTYRNQCTWSAWQPAQHITHGEATLLAVQDRF